MTAQTPARSVDGHISATCSPRERVRSALAQCEPDRAPLDFVATPPVLALISALGIQALPPTNDGFFDARRESVLRSLDVDCQVISYDRFCAPPDTVLPPAAHVDGWGSLNRSAPAHRVRADSRTD